MRCTRLRTRWCRPDLAAVFAWSHAYYCEAAGRSPCDLSSNGAVMRCAVSGAVGVAPTCSQTRTLVEVARDAVTMGQITHADPRCSASVAFVATLVHQLLRWRQEHPMIAAEAPPASVGSPTSVAEPAPKTPAQMIGLPSSDVVEAMIAVCDSLFLFHRLV
jgi:ADP-ribosylglycohydrolase